MRRVAVSAHQDLARLRKAGDVHRVADAVAGAGHVHAEALRRGLKVDVVVRGLEINVKKIVVQVRDGALGADTVQADSLKGEIGHDGIDIVGQSLIDPDKDVLSRGHIPRNKV